MPSFNATEGAQSAVQTGVTALGLSGGNPLAALGASLLSFIQGGLGNNSQKFQAEFNNDVSAQVANKTTRFETLIGQSALNEEEKQAARDFFNNDTVEKLKQNPYIFDIGQPEPRYPKGNVDFDGYVTKVINGIKQIGNQSTQSVASASIPTIDQSLLQDIQDIKNTVLGIIPKDGQPGTNFLPLAIGAGVIGLILLLRKK